MATKDQGFMEPQQTAARYDQLAGWWQTQHQNSSYGIWSIPRKSCVYYCPKTTTAPFL